MKKNIDIRDMVVKIHELYFENLEMTTYESEFLCGIISKIRPKKILEVGVAAGGTTAIIMQCLNELNLASQVISCDLNKQYYRDKKLDTGFLMSSIKHKFATIKHTFMLGAYLPEFLDDIGGDIDLVIIDTVHTMPGEILDFLAVLPFMKNNGVVILHDVAFSYYYHNCLPSNAVLMASIVGQRIEPGDDKDRASGYPNIGGFYLNDDTRKYIINVFSSLLLDWEYVPSKHELMIYKKHYEKYYTEKEINLFEKAIFNNRNNVRNRVCKKLFDFDDKDIIKAIIKEEQVIFWGAGSISRFWEDVLLRAGIAIRFIISRDDIQRESDNRIPIIRPDECDFSAIDDMIIVMSSRYDKEIETTLINYGVQKYCTYNEFKKKVFGFFMK